MSIHLAVLPRFGSNAWAFQVGTHQEPRDWGLCGTLRWWALNTLNCAYSPPQTRSNMGGFRSSGEEEQGSPFKPDGTMHFWMNQHASDYKGKPAVACSVVVVWPKMLLVMAL